MTAAQKLARGDIVLVRFPFTDLSTDKVRPVFIVGRPSGGDVVVAFITSRVTTGDPQAEYLLQPADPEFRVTGLR